MLPSVDGWVLILTSQGPETIAEFVPPLTFLSEHFGEAQFFASYRVTDVYGWGRAERGEVERLVLTADGESEQFGNPTRTEDDLLDDQQDSDEDADDAEEATDDWDSDEWHWLIDEQFVLQLAEEWSVNPSTLTETFGIPQASGYWGTTDIDCLFRSAPLDPGESQPANEPSPSEPPEVLSPPPGSWRHSLVNWLTQSRSS